MGKHKRKTVKCKCCLGEDKLKHLWIEYYHNGEREVYGEMLNDCFALNWEQPVKKSDSDIERICSKCVSKLYAAVNFKKEIFICEQLLLEGNKNDSCEMKMDNDSDIYVETEYLNIEYVEDEDIKQEKSDIKKEDPTTTNHELCTNLNTKSKHYKEEDLKNCLEAVKSKFMSLHKASIVYNVPSWTIRNALNKIENLDETLRLKSKDPFVLKLQENMSCIMTYTNATPIRGFLRAGYACHFCPKEYEEPSDLKKHVTEVHGTDDILRVMVQSNRPVKLDVTDLMCNICDQKMDTLESVFEHLSAIHEITIHNDTRAFLVPFKFDSELFKCTVCSQQYYNFIPLVRHMYANHYKNYVCAICGRGFITKKALRNHSYLHETGAYKCTFCPKVFSAKVRKFAHERSVHLLKNKQLICGYCPERFPDAARKKTHEVNVHNAKQPIYRCQACNKTYKLQSHLTNHIQTFHLLMTPYKCEVHDYSTYKHKSWKNHLRTQHGELA